MNEKDYFVLAYKILQHLYECLKEGKEADRDYMKLGTDDFPIGEEYLEYILINLAKKDLIDGVKTVTYLGQEPTIKKIYKMQITPEGIEYLQEDRMMQKAEKYVKLMQSEK